MTRAIALALVIVLGACHQEDPGPPCDKVVDVMLGLTGQAMAQHERMHAGKRGVMIDQCEKQKLPPAVRTCLVNAKTLADLATCRRAVPLTQEEIDNRNRAGSDRHYVAPPVAPGSGSGSATGSGSGSATGSASQAP